MGGKRSKSSLQSTSTLALVKLMIRDCIFITVFTLALVSGCSDNDPKFPQLRGFSAVPTEAIDAIESASYIEIYSLQPWVSGKQSYRDHAISHQTKIQEASDIIDVFLVFKKITKDDGNWFENDCFDPRFVLLCGSDGQNLEILLSFECGKGELYKEGTKTEFTLSQTNRREFEILINAIMIKSKYNK